MMEVLGTAADAVTGFLGDSVMNMIQSILYATVYRLLYYLSVGICWLMDLIYQMVQVFAGLSKVQYKGDTEYLINIFFTNTTVSKIYWGMALIGICMAFGFAIAAVIRKLFDMSEKEKRPYGAILRGLFKSILIIICMSLIITMVLNATNLLMQQVNFVFDHADELGQDESITFTDEEFATMARVLNTIGNYSLNPSYDNRYNINACFNEIRLDLQYLQQQKVFEFYYETTDAQGNSIETWQSALQRIANSASLSRELKMDVYYESVSNAILDTMELMRVNGNFKPLEFYQRPFIATRESVPLDRLLFLMSSMRAAKNEDYNTNASMTDALRAPYYYGQKSIYDLESVNADFDIAFHTFDYIILVLAAVKLLQSLATIVLNCIARIFNMLLLYLVAPPTIAAMPLDDGGKFKQWTTAFVVQSLSVFGTVISTRVLLLFLPIVMGSDLVLFQNPILNILGKLIMVLGSFEVAEKATALITGILADNAGWQSITAGDMSGTATKAVEMGKAHAMKAASFGMGATLGAGKLAAKAVGYSAVGAGLVAGGTVLGAGYLGYGAVKGGMKLAEKINAWRNERNADSGGGDSGGGSSGGGGGGDSAAAPLPGKATSGGAPVSNSDAPGPAGGGSVSKPVPKTLSGSYGPGGLPGRTDRGGF